MMEDLSLVQSAAAEAAWRTWCPPPTVWRQVFVLPHVSVNSQVRVMTEGHEPLVVVLTTLIWTLVPQQSDNTAGSQYPTPCRTARFCWWDTNSAASSNNWLFPHEKPLASLNWALQVCRSW